jgi:transcription elongation GreA/GreB family factor
MSRAFTKEDGPDNAPLPDLPISPHPNFVTPRGLRALQDRLAETQATLARLKTRKDRLDRNPEKAAERDIRYLDARLKSAILVQPPAAPAEVVFATAVTVSDEAGIECTYEIVGEDEADAARGRIAPQSPLARALLGAEPGDSVTWRRPSGAAVLDVLRIEPLPS